MVFVKLSHASYRLLVVLVNQIIVPQQCFIVLHIIICFSSDLHHNVDKIILFPNTKKNTKFSPCLPYKKYTFYTPTLILEPNFINPLSAILSLCCFIGIIHLHFCIVSGLHLSAELFNHHKHYYFYKHYLKHLELLMFNWYVAVSMLRISHTHTGTAAAVSHSLPLAIIPTCQCHIATSSTWDKHSHVSFMDGIHSGNLKTLIFQERTFHF